MILGALALVVVGSYVGTRIPDLTDMEETRERLEQTERQLTAAEAQLQDLRAGRTQQQARAVELSTQIAELEREVGTLQASLALSGPLGEHYTTLASELATLQTRYNALQVDYATLEGQSARLVRIRTPELPGDALLLDRGVRGVTYTGAVCSGSMEPNITCEDLLILYPPAITDLGVGDIIYFPRRSADCSAILENRFLLHRITAVTAGEAGVRYQTKGDALSGPDPCPVPASEVMYKLLANIRNARIDE